MKINRLKRRKAKDLSRERRRWRAIIPTPGMTLLDIAKRDHSNDDFIKQMLEADSKIFRAFDDAIHEEIMSKKPRRLRGLAWRFKRWLN